jgi:hypothetical protein
MLIPSLYFSAHVGPFYQYSSTSFALVVATSPTKTSLPKWANEIKFQVPHDLSEETFSALIEDVQTYTRIILLFPDFATFKAWQRKLTEVLS